MTYVDAILEKDKHCIHVVERVNHKRVYNTYPSKYVMYFPSERGKYTSIYGERLDKFETNRWEEFQRECRLVPKTQQYESDSNPIFRCFYEHYKNTVSPQLHVAFFDIEVSFEKFKFPEDYHVKIRKKHK